ncbi:MAG: DoxX family membrane protein [Microbacteriaceae bacterium]|nr:DoxX family membrane protein [Microbacteriaceae bacterium]
MTPATVEIAQWAVRALLALIFVVMGVNHFRPKPARMMARMIPPALHHERGLTPIRLVYVTGLCEIAGGIGLLLPATRLAAGIALVLFLVAVFPANHVAAQHPERFGAIAVPFWPRYWAQLVLILLVVLTFT